MTTSRAPTDVDIQVGLTVRKLRIENNLTLAELGRAVGISHQQMQKYEVGTNRLSAGMLASLAGVFGIGVGDLFENQPAGPPVPATLTRDLARIKSITEKYVTA